MNLTHYSRRPCEGVYSLERLYTDVRQHLPEQYHVSVCVNRFFSCGILRRLADALRALCYQGEVNHITGDVHYLSYFLPRKRTVLTILDCVCLENSNGLRFWLLWFFWFWLPVKRCAVIPVISDSTRQQVLKYVRCNPAKVRVIYCNVSKEFESTPLCFNEKRPRILHVGTAENKNLVRHAAALEGVSCKLIVVGVLNDEQRYALEKHGICYENYTDLSRLELVSHYQDCDLVLFASTYEGFGLPIVEAQSVGRPVITSRLWSMPEVAGKGACLVDPFDPLSIREGVRRIISDSAYRDDLIQSGFENIQRFQIEEIAAQYAALYREVYENAQPSN